MGKTADQSNAIHHELTTESLKLFMELALDAQNWNGTPLVGGNVEINKQRRGNLTDLKRVGLLTTFKEDSLMWVDFTPKGKEFAANLEIII